MVPSQPSLGKTGLAPCEYVLEGVWPGAKATLRIFTKPGAAASASCSELYALQVQTDDSWPPCSVSLSPVLQAYHRLQNELTVQGDYVFRGFRLITLVSLRHDLVALLS